MKPRAILWVPYLHDKNVDRAVLFPVEVRQRPLSVWKYPILSLDSLARPRNSYTGAGKRGPAMI